MSDYFHPFSGEATYACTGFKRSWLALGNFSAIFSRFNWRSETKALRCLVFFMTSVVTRRWNLRSVAGTTFSRLERYGLRSLLIMTLKDQNMIRFQSSHAWTCWLTETRFSGESLPGASIEFVYKTRWVQSYLLLWFTTYRGFQSGFLVWDDIFIHALSLSYKKSGWNRRGGERWRSMS